MGHRSLICGCSSRAGITIVKERKQMRMETLVHLVLYSLLISNFAKSEGSNVDSKLDLIYLTFLSSCFGRVVVVFNEIYTESCTLQGAS